MMRVRTWLVAVLLIAGCKGSGGGAVWDPFSRTRVEPPRTGSIMGQPADPYYTRQAAAPAGSGASNVAMSQPGPHVAADRPAGAPAVASGAELAPAKPRWDTFSFSAVGDRQGSGGLAQSAMPSSTTPGDRVTIPAAARNEGDRTTRTGQSAGLAGAYTNERGVWETASSQTVVTPSAVATADARTSFGDRVLRSETGQMDVAAARGERILGTIQPGLSPRSFLASPPGPAAATRSPQRAAMPQGVVDIMDLPPAGSTSRGTTSQQRGTGVARLASATEELDGPRAGGPVATASLAVFQAETSSRSPTASPRFGHDASYEWLRGRLEYSEIDRRWKLRYIPIDGETDQYGGSVVIANPSQLAGYERGQFVEVHGRLGRAPAADDCGYAPEYEVQRIERQGS